MVREDRRRSTHLRKSPHLHAIAGMRRLDQLALADIDTDVAGPVSVRLEEHEIAGLDLARIDANRRVGLPLLAVEGDRVNQQNAPFGHRLTY